MYIYHLRLPSYLLTFFWQFIREYTGKVDELIKDKLESLSEVKAKEKEEKDIMAQQVFALTTLC